MVKIFIRNIIFVLGFCSLAFGTGFEIKIDDDKILINDLKFRAISTCKELKSGDKVIFTKGSSKGRCLKAEIFNIEKNISCQIWCDS